MDGYIDNKQRPQIKRFSTGIKFAAKQVRPSTHVAGQRRTVCQPPQPPRLSPPGWPSSVNWPRRATTHYRCVVVLPLGGGDFCFSENKNVNLTPPRRHHERKTVALPRKWASTQKAFCSAVGQGQNAPKSYPLPPGNCRQMVLRTRKGSWRDRHCWAGS